MNPFYGEGNRRAIQGEIRFSFQDLTNSTLVCGFEQMIDAGEAILNTNRISGFNEAGDRREWLLRLSSSKGMSWNTKSVPENCVDAVSFVLNIGLGNGDPLPQPTGAWEFWVNGKFALSIRGVNHSQLWRGSECVLAFAASRIESAPPYCSLCLSSILKNESTAAFGPALLKVPVRWLERGRAATIEVRPVCAESSTRWLQLAPSASLVQNSDIWAVADMLTRDPHPRAGDYKVFFGDIHTHSGQIPDQCTSPACGMGSRESNYEYAKGPGALDFYSLTDHEYQIDPANVGEYMGLADLYNENGRFACLPGFEYTNLLYGHRNVYFRDSGGSVFNSNINGGRPTLDPASCNTPADLWHAMERTGIPFITVPHHPSATAHPLNLDFHDSRYDRLYEIYSSWGSSEYYGDYPRGSSDRFHVSDFQDAMRRGLRYGVMASSDGHDGHPGNAQSPLHKHHHIFHFCGSGRAVVLAPELTRADVFDALYARRCYATTGVPLLLNCTVSGAVMGSEIPALPSGSVPQVSLSCVGTNGLDHIRIIKNGRIVHTIPCHGQRTFRYEWEDKDYQHERTVSYYVRVVQVDRESAWSSPVWVG